MARACALAAQPPNAPADLSLWDGGLLLLVGGRSESGRGILIGIQITLGGVGYEKKSKQFGSLKRPLACTVGWLVGWLVV